jgi:hypothetical protein
MSIPEARTCVKVLIGVVRVAPFGGARARAKAMGVNDGDYVYVALLPSTHPFDPRVVRRERCSTWWISSGGGPPSPSPLLLVLGFSALRLQDSPDCPSLSHRFS